MRRRAWITVVASCAVSLGVVLLNTGVCLGDTVNGGVYNIADTKSAFAGDGWWETIDSANDGLNGPPYHVTSGGAANWEFFLTQSTTGWGDLSAQNVRVEIKGTHLHGPHTGLDIDPNDLGRLLSFPVNIPYAVGSMKTFALSRWVDHPTTDRQHRDYFSLKAVIGAYPDTTGSSKLGGTWDISAKHRGRGGETSAERSSVTFGSGPGSGTTVAFNPGGGGILSLAVGAINIMDAVGGLSGGIDPAYVGDSFQGGTVAVTDMPYLGSTPDGRYRFGGCELTVTDPAGVFHFVADFGDYTVETTVGGKRVTSFSLNDSLKIIDAGEPAGNPSVFLEDFTYINLLGSGYSEQQWLANQGIMLTFLTETDLVAATNGFTQSATLPATVIVTSSTPVQTPVASARALALLALALVATAAAALSMRRRGAGSEL